MIPEADDGPTSRCNEGEEHMIDRYTKAILTMIALALMAISMQLSVGPGAAQVGRECGQSSSSPCYVQISTGEWGINVNVTSR
jgi:hypothetical protein